VWNVVGAERTSKHLYWKYCLQKQNDARHLLHRAEYREARFAPTNEKKIRMQKLYLSPKISYIFDSCPLCTRLRIKKKISTFHNYFQNFVLFSHHVFFVVVYQVSLSRKISWNKNHNHFFVIQMSFRWARARAVQRARFFKQEDKRFFKGTIWGLSSGFGFCSKTFIQFCSIWPKLQNLIVYTWNLTFF
jgi:hypothetical protein